MISFPSISCDWLTVTHKLATPCQPINGGKIQKIRKDGVVEWESQSWESIKCASSDTSIRIRCDGRKVQLSGNIGRFREHDNLYGLTVMECLEKWREVLVIAGIRCPLFGASPVDEDGAGTTITRVDLAGNFNTDNFSALNSNLATNKLGQLLPVMGAFGVMWGYEKGRRNNWVRAKIYDKAAEMNGNRKSKGGATLARFEVQLGAEYLKREALNRPIEWRNERAKIMENVIFGKFATQAFREQATVETWNEIPARVRPYAILWRDGVDIRNEVSRSQYFKIAKNLRNYGIDISVPCNVMTLTQKVRVVTVTPIHALRRYA